MPSPSAKGERSGNRRGPEPDIERMDLDGLTAFVIDNGFAPVLIGRIMIMLGGTEDGIERSIAFAAIIAKALKSRRRRNG
jgi:hypothetical protein